MSTVQPDSTAPLRTARSWGEGFVQTPAFEILSRAGFVARALVYGIIGLLAFDLAIGHGGKITNQQGALRTVEQQSFGHVLLAVLAIGLGGYAVWRLFRAVLGHGAEGADRGIERLGALGKRDRLRGACAPSQSRSSPAPARRAAVRRRPRATSSAGPPAAGWSASPGSFSRAWRSTSSSAACGRSSSTTRRPSRFRATLMPWFKALGTIGHVARAVVFALVAVFLHQGRVRLQGERGDRPRRRARQAVQRRLRLMAARRRRPRADRLLVLLAPRGALPAHLRSSRHGGAQSRARPRPLAALRRHGERDVLGRDERAVSGRDPRPRTSTFTVEGHHYALLLVDDLAPASVTPYDVRLDGELVWPPDDGRPQPVVHTRDNEPRTRLVFGSCRVGDPQPTNLGREWPDDVKTLGIDALWTYSKQLQRGEMEWPDAVLLLGDQVYADEVSPETLEFIEQRRGTDTPARRADRRLRGVHAALSRVVVRARHPLAALDRADRDDLRRPRRQRRLEHLVALGRGDAS